MLMNYHHTLVNLYSYIRLNHIYRSNGYETSLINSDLQLGHLGEFRTDILHDVNHRQEGSQGDGVVEDAGGIQRHVDAHEQGAQPFGEVPS